MISAVSNKSQALNKDLAIPVVNLRAVRSKFFRSYINATAELTAHDLSAFLLYFALSFIGSNRDLAKLFKTAASTNKQLKECEDKELVLLGYEFLGLLNEFLPENLIDALIVPDAVSWRRASQFFKEQSALFSDIANLGFLYQIFSLTNRKEKALPALQKANKIISKEELIAFTQLYTPNWVVDFLISNTILSNYKVDKISFRYLRWLMIDNDIRKTNRIDLETFSLIDPACGAGQFIFSAFDLLSELYELHGYNRQEAATLILKRNIFAADIDEKALWILALGLLSKYLVVCDSINSMPERLSNLALVNALDINLKTDEDDFLGSIDNRLPANHLLKKEYSVVLTNPPYIGRRCLSRGIKRALKEQYPNSCSDLSAAFLERCLTMLKTGGKLGVITQSSVMSIPSYGALRNYLLKNYRMQAAIQCGPGVFTLASGEKIDSILLLINKDLTGQKVDEKSNFVDLTRERNKAAALEIALNSGSHILIDQSDFIHGLPNKLLRQLSSTFFKKIKVLPSLSDIADIRQGLATTNNARFVRYYFDVDEELIGKTWVPYVKGAGAERYASDNPFVVKWEDNGKEIKEAVASAYPYLKGNTAWVVKNEGFYFRPGLCFSFINKSGLAVRRLPAGAIFDVASSAIFTSAVEENFLLAYLNSRVIGALAKDINQTINIQVGDLKKIPVVPVDANLKEEISRLGNLAFETKKALLNCVAILLKQNASMLSADDLSMILSKYIKRRSELQDILFQVQTDIDNKVMDAMEINGLISSAERKILEINFGPSERQEYTEKQFLYQMLNTMVAKVMANSSEANEERIVLIPFINKENLAKLFNLTKEGMDWFEIKLGISIEKIFQAKIVDVSKLAQEPSRYFSFFVSEYNSCFLFSSAAARRFKKDMSMFIAEPAIPGSDLLDKVHLLWHDVFARLDTKEDWTSKDLFVVFKALTI